MWAILHILLIAFLLLATAPTSTNAQSNSNNRRCVNEENICDGPGFDYRPLPTCQQYVLCINGERMSTLDCGTGSIYDELLQRCNFEYNSFCIVKSCAPTPPPTGLPSESPSYSPSYSPSGSPSVSPSASPTGSPSDPPSASPSTSPPTVNYDFFAELETDTMRLEFEQIVLQYYNPAGIASPSTKYTYNVLIDTLKEMIFEGITSAGRTFKFYAGAREQNEVYGRVNVAAFLANAMTESIQYDTCDEFNTDAIAGRYAIANSCGQNSRSYQDEVCTNVDELDMSCPVDVGMNVVSSGYATGMSGRAPPPFSCRPKEYLADYAGYWDARTGVSSKTAYANALGRTDLEGCCFWGRGVLLTRGVCNIGKLNYYLGKRAFVERGEGRFPAIDFCAFPEGTCANEQGQEGTEEVRWIVGLFEWIERVQSYRDWDYISNLQKFVDRGMKDDSFIDTVSSIFTRDCHLTYCSNLEVTKKEERRENFKKVLDIFRLPQLTPNPTDWPTSLPATPKPTTAAPTRGISAPSLTGGQQQSPPSNENIIQNPAQPQSNNQYYNPTVQQSPTSDVNIVQNPSQQVTPGQPNTIQQPVEIQTPGQPPMIAHPESPREPIIPSIPTTTTPLPENPDDVEEGVLIGLEDNAASSSSLVILPWIVSLSLILSALY